MKKFAVVMLSIAFVLCMPGCSKKQRRNNISVFGNVQPTYQKTDETGAHSTIAIVTDFTDKFREVEKTEQGRITPDKKHYVVNTGKSILYSDFDGKETRLDFDKKAGLKLVSNRGFIYNLDSEDDDVPGEMYMATFEGNIYDIGTDSSLLLKAYGNDTLSVIVHTEKGPVLAMDNGEKFEIFSEYESGADDGGKYHLLDISDDCRNFVILECDFMGNKCEILVFKDRKLVATEETTYFEVLGEISRDISVYKGKNGELFLVPINSKFIFKIEEYEKISTLFVGYNINDPKIYDSQGLLASGQDMIEDEFYVSVNQGSKKLIIKLENSDKLKEGLVVRDNLKDFVITDGYAYGITDDNMVAKINLLTGKAEFLDSDGADAVYASPRGNLVYYTRRTDQEMTELYCIKNGKKEKVEDLKGEVPNKCFVQVDIYGNYLYYYQNVNKIQDTQQYRGTLYKYDVKKGKAEFIGEEVMVYSLNSGLVNNYINDDEFYFVTHMSPHPYVEYQMGQLHYFSNGKSIAIAERINTGLIGFVY